MTSESSKGVTDADNVSGRDLQQSQAAGAGDGSFARDAMQVQTGGTQMGGGPDASDMAAPGGSSGTGGYGNAQNQANHQGQERGPEGHDLSQSRGERYDEDQGGGRGGGSVSGDEVARAGGSSGSFDQVQDNDPLTKATDAFFRSETKDEDREQARTEFESDAQS